VWADQAVSHTLATGVAQNPLQGICFNVIDFSGRKERECWKL
jgi:hypothetical protein